MDEVKEAGLEQVLKEKHKCSICIKQLSGTSKTAMYLQNICNRSVKELIFFVELGSKNDSRENYRTQKDKYTIKKQQYKVPMCKPNEKIYAKTVARAAGT